MTAPKTTIDPKYIGAAAAIITASIIPSISITPILPKMQAYYSSVPQVDILVQLVYALPGLMSMIAAPFSGVISDRIGRRGMVIVAVFLATLLGTLPFIQESIWEIIVSRALLGLCQGVLIVCTSALIADYFAKRRRELVLGLKFGSVGIANIILFILAGIVSENDWRNVFLLYLWGVLAVLLVVIFIRKSPSRNEDVIKQESIAIPWKSLAVPYAGAFLGAASFTLLFSQLPFLLEVRDISDSPTFAGITTSIASAGMFVTAFSYAKVIRHMTGTALWVITFAMVAIGCGVLSISGNLVGVIAGVVIIGLGCGFVSPNSLNMVLARVAPEGRGRVAGIQTTFFFLGIFGGPMLGITLLRILGSVGAIFAAWAVLCVFASAAYYLLLREESARESHNAVSN